MSRQVDQIMRDIQRLTLQERLKLLAAVEDMEWARLSETSFAEDWYSEEDSAYDSLQSR